MWRWLPLILLALACAGCADPPPEAGVPVGDLWRVTFPLPADYKYEAGRDGWGGPTGGRLRALDAGPLKSGQDLETPARAWVSEIRSDPAELVKLQPLDLRGHPTLRATVKRRSGPSEILFVNVDNHLVVIEMRTPPGTEAQLAAGMDALADAVRFSSSDAADERSYRPPGWRELMWKGVPLAVLLLFTSVPAWMGAAAGYKTAEAFGENPRAGAASGAFRATFWGVLVGVFITSALLFVLLSQSKSSGGIMTPMTAWILITVVLLLFGVGAGAIAGVLAMAGASLGASRGCAGAAAGAALFASPGAVAAVFMMRYGAGSDSRRGEIPPRRVRVAWLQHFTTISPFRPTAIAASLKQDPPFEKATANEEIPSAPRPSHRLGMPARVRVAPGDRA